MINTKTDLTMFVILPEPEPAGSVSIRTSQEQAFKEAKPIPVFDVLSRLKVTSEKEVWIYHYTPTEESGVFRLNYAEFGKLPNDQQIVDEAAFFEGTAGPLYSTLSPSGEEEEEDVDDYGESVANTELYERIRSQYQRQTTGGAQQPSRVHSSGASDSSDTIGETGTTMMKHVAVGLFIAGVLKHV